MAGQEQIKQYNQYTLLNKHQEKLKTQVKNWYLKEHFALTTEFNEIEAIHSYLFSSVYSTDNCELKKFIDKGIKGLLGKEKIKPIKLPEVEEQEEVHNHFHVEANYREVRW